MASQRGGGMECRRRGELGPELHEAIHRGVEDGKAGRRLSSAIGRLAGGEGRPAKQLHLTGGRQAQLAAGPPWLFHELGLFDREGALDFLRANPALPKEKEGCAAELGWAWFYRLAGGLARDSAPELVGGSLVLAAWAMEDALATPEWAGWRG